MTKRRNKKRKAAQQDQVSRLRASRLPPVPAGAVLADPSQQVPWGSYAAPPTYYVDVDFVCWDCGDEETWTAADQKWYYEVAKGSLYGRAKYCRACRRWRRANLATLAGNWSPKRILRRIKAGLEAEFQDLGFSLLVAAEQGLEFDRNDSRIALDVERSREGGRVTAWYVDRDTNRSLIVAANMSHCPTRVTDEKFEDWLKAVRRFARNLERGP